MEVRTRITLELYSPEMVQNSPAMVQNIKCKQYDTKRILEIIVKNRGSPLVLSPTEHEVQLECAGASYECQIADDGYLWCYIPSFLTDTAGAKSATLHINAKSGIGRGEEISGAHFYISVLPAEYNKTEIEERIAKINGTNN